MFKDSQIAEITGGQTSGPLSDQTLTHVIIDSRLLGNPRSTLFVCLKGSRRDGHQFIGELYQKGVRHFIVTSDTVERPQQAVFYRVEDAVVALQALASTYRQTLAMPVVGITGSNGKTIVKEWLFQLLSPDLDVYRSPGSYNSQIGVALSVLGIPHSCDLAIIEAGISRPGEMTILERMIRPDHGIFTNLGDAHDAGFTSREQKLEEKLKLFSGAKWWIGHDLPIENSRNYRPWSIDEGKGLVVKWEGPSINLQGLRFLSPFEDPASLQNLSQCLVFCHHFDPELLGHLQKRVLRLERVSMRTDVHRGIRHCKVISDHYNLDLASLLNVLELADQVGGNLDKVMVLSDFRDNESQASFYQSVLDKIASHELSELHLIGANWQDLKSELNTHDIQCHFWRDTSAFIENGSYHRWRHKLIILKGGRDFKFEDIEKHLLRPVYGTRLEVDLSALRHNWLTLSRLLEKGVRRMVMIKASAYGSGSEELARFFQDNQVDYLGVAYVNEAVTLRESGIRIPIMIMNAEARAVPMMLKYDLEPEIHSFEQSQAIFDEIPPGQVLKVHLKCETGMHRLGFEANELNRLGEMLRQNKDMVKVVSILSHLSAADDPGADAYTRKQIGTFSSMYKSIVDQIGYQPLKHIANSAATLRFPGSHFDMVRMGIALYGVGLDHPVMKDLQPVHTLKTYVIQVRDRKAGDYIGYGLDGQVTKDSRIATIPLGYADGIPRHLGNSGLEVFIRGKKAVSVGRICMDMTMVDVTGIPDCQIHDEVEIFGQHATLDEFAKKAGTIPYEVLVSLGNRIERVITKA